MWRCSEELLMPDDLQHWRSAAARAAQRSNHKQIDHKQIDQNQTYHKPAFSIQRARTLHMVLDALIRQQSGRAFAFTSVRALDGKAGFCVALANHLALMGHRVLVMDADLYHPSLHQYFSRGHSAREAHVGLSQLVLGDGTLGALKDFLHRTAQANVYFLPAGRIDLHPAALLNSPRLGLLLHLCRKAYDVILINCTPLDQAGGTYPISRLVDATALLMEADNLSHRRTGQALRQLALSGGAPLPVVLDEARPMLPLASQRARSALAPHVKTLQRQARQLYDWLLQVPNAEPDKAGGAKASPKKRPTLAG
jgi:Mrp family chromosome partitioning ATPase